MLLDGNPFRVAACNQVIRAKDKMTLHIWVDADACPKIIKEVLFKAARRLQLPLTLVANQSLATPPDANIKSVVVSHGFDVADNYIVSAANAGDLVITGDIPLAALVIEKGANVLGPRGERYTRDNIGQRLQMRNFMEEMRNAGQATGGPPPLDARDKQTFANALDRLLAKINQ